MISPEQMNVSLVVYHTYKYTIATRQWWKFLFSSLLHLILTARFSMGIASTQCIMYAYMHGAWLEYIHTYIHTAMNAHTYS